MPVMSPRTQQLQAGMTAGPDQEVALFEQGFSEMAYNLLAAKMPDLLQDVVTFKTLSTDIDQGTGIGAFIVLRNGAPIYVPVVMCDNNIKPLEVFYHKASNVFLPLTRGWLEEIDKNTLGGLGRGVKTPETLYTDVDIRNVVVPPITGRFSYASWVPKAFVDVARVCTPDNLEKTASAQAPLNLPVVLAQAPNCVKQAFARMLGANERVFKQAASIYGMTTLRDALRPHVEKVAAKQHHGGALWIADKDSKPEEFRRVFGDQAGEAFAGVKLKGYVAKDTRTARNQVVQEQPYAAWTEPNQPGVYTLFNVDGREQPAFVAVQPIDLFDAGDPYTRRPPVPSQTVSSRDKTYPMGRPDDRSRRRGYGAPTYFAVFGDGDFVEADKLVGRASIIDDVDGGARLNLFKGGGTPRTGKGFFVRRHGTTYQATVPLEIKSIATGADGVRRMQVTNLQGWDERTLATDPRNALNALVMPKGSTLTYLPDSFMWVPLKAKQDAKTFHTSPLELQAQVSRALGSVGAKPVSVKSAGANQFSINGARAVARLDALKKLAYEQALAPVDADALLTKAAADRRVVAWVVSGPQLARAQVKLAAEPPPAEAAPADPAQDPAMQDPAMMAPAPPPPPTPVELAAMEMDQQIQQEMQKLQDKQQMLASLVQRSSEIAGGAPPAPTVQTQAMGAPPASQNLATGGPGLPGGPTAGMGAAPGMDPAMAGTAPGGPVPANTMDPMAAQGMDPSMGGQPGMDPGMDPSMGGQPGMPNAVMPVDGPNAQALGQEVNPQFLEQAGQLHAADMFDAAAVASLAQSPALHGIVSQYLPNLEKAVDNLGRVLLTLWMQEYDLKPQVGEVTYTGLEESLQSTFKGMGSLVLRLSRGVQAIKAPDDHEE